MDHEGGSIEQSVRLGFSTPETIEKRELSSESSITGNQPLTLGDIPLTWFLVGGGLIIVFILLFLIQSVRLRLAHAQS